MSASRIKGSEGVVIDSNRWLELPKAATKTTSFPERAGMIRYNNEWKAFEGVITFSDNSVAYRRFANLDENGLLLTSQLPSSVTSGMDYMGTYSPLVDDVDPPLTGNTPLPAPTPANSGQYLIVRGLFDVAVQHFTSNPSAVSPVRFTPVNPLGTGNWIEIKYYIGVDPNDDSKKIVNQSYGRIITAAIPASGHVGLKSLATDPDLTAAFTNSDTPTTEKALTDGDWVISDGSRIQRIRNNRVSITASSVLYDRGIVESQGRSFKSSSATVQAALDQLSLDGLRRTGDTMYNDGGIGKGRLGVTLGSPTAPAIAFNSVGTPGIDPSKWSDGTTGIYSPAKGQIGFTVNGVSQIELLSGNSKFHGNITLDQSLIIGTANATTVRQVGTVLRFDMAAFSDVSIMDGTTERVKFNRYGLKLPVLNPVNNSVGEDGMIAYSSADKAVLQKSDGAWKGIGTANLDSVPFTNASWVVSGTDYSFTLAKPNIKSIIVQELVGSNYSPVEVDSVVITATNVVIKIPGGTPDLRFTGRVLYFT